MLNQNQNKGKINRALEYLCFQGSSYSIANRSRKKVNLSD
jgi:hypothetical protein